MKHKSKIGKGLGPRKAPKARKKAGFELSESNKWKNCFLNFSCFWCLSWTVFLKKNREYVDKQGITRTDPLRIKKYGMEYAVGE